MSRKIDKDIEQYYADRAYEYDKTYLRPERQKDIKKLNKLLKNLLSGHIVLEVACGTGYWTKTIASVSKFITAVDINNKVLQIANNREIPSDVGMQFESIFEYEEEQIENTVDLFLEFIDSIPYPRNWI